MAGWGKLKCDGYIHVSPALLAESNKPSKDWTTGIKKVYEVDPLECPKCGGRMKIKSFIHDYRELQQLHIKKYGKKWAAPPPLSTSNRNNEN